jgi:hypothetical protein
MPRKVPLPDPLAMGAFSISQGQSLGLTEGRMRGADLRAPFSGVRILRSTPEPEWPRDRMVAAARAFAPRLTAGQFFAELTAAAIHGMPIPDGHSSDTVVHVGVPFPARSPRVRGARGHQYRHATRITRDKLPVCTPLQAWTQCAARLSIDDLVVLGDSLVRRKAPIATLDEVHHAATHFRGRGARNLREAGALVRPRTDSPRETLIRLVLIHAGLPEPVVNFEIVDRHGVFTALADMAYPAYRVAIEYDGLQHFAEEQQHHRDVDRLDSIMAERWRVIRVNRSHLRAPAVLVARVAAALRDAGWSS